MAVLEPPRENYQRRHASTAKQQSADDEQPRPDRLPSKAVVLHREALIAGLQFTNNALVNGHVHTAPSRR